MVTPVESSRGVNFLFYEKECPAVKSERVEWFKESNQFAPRESVSFIRSVDIFVGNLSISSKNANDFTHAPPTKKQTEKQIVPHKKIFPLSPPHIRHQKFPPNSFELSPHNLHLIRFMYGGCSCSGGFRGEPCTIQCVLAMGTIPQLQCKKCLCLFHPECVQLHNYTKTFSQYICEVSRGEVTTHRDNITILLKKNPFSFSPSADRRIASTNQRHRPPSPPPPPISSRYISPAKCNWNRQSHRHRSKNHRPQRRHIRPCRTTNR